MALYPLLPLSGGIGLFLYGITLLGDGLETLAGRTLTRVLRRLTGGPWRAMLLGLAVTAVIQSSTAVTVMTVGLVNAGVLTLAQAAGVILGANVGTTATAWLIALSDLPVGGLLLLLRPAALGPLLAFVGGTGQLLLSSPRAKALLKPVLGLGLLFLGMETMESAMAPLADSAAFQSLFLHLRSPLAAILAGALVTAALQSSSASVGLLQALAAAGMVPFSTSVYIIMGQNIGTCITVLLAGVGAGTNARRAALVHLYFNLLGTLVFSTGIVLLRAAVGIPFWEDPITRSGISLFHTLFNLVNTLWLLPCLPLLLRLVCRTLPESPARRRLRPGA